MSHGETWSGMERHYHKFEVKLQPRGCGNKSLKFNVCSCGERQYLGESSVVENHTNEPVRIIKAPTCTEDGEQLLRCTKCFTEKTIRIPATGHNYKNHFFYKICEHDGCGKKIKNKPFIVGSITAATFFFILLITVLVIVVNRPKKAPILPESSQAEEIEMSHDETFSEEITAETEATTAEPELTTEEPEITTAETEATTTEPETTTEEPEITTVETEATTTEPETTTEEPEITTVETEATTTEPETTTAVPETTSVVTPTPVPTTEPEPTTEEKITYPTLSDDDYINMIGDIYSGTEVLEYVNSRLPVELITNKGMKIYYNVNGMSHGETSSIIATDTYTCNIVEKNGQKIIVFSQY